MSTTAALTAPHRSFGERFDNHPQLKSSGKPRAQVKAQRFSKECSKAEGEYIFFSDADLAVPIATLSAFIDELKNGCDIAIGSRRERESKIEVHQWIFREALGVEFLFGYLTCFWDSTIRI